jgi:hypothetical protein
MRVRQPSRKRPEGASLLRLGAADRHHPGNQQERGPGEQLDSNLRYHPDNQLAVVWSRRSPRRGRGFSSRNGDRNIPAQTGNLWTGKVALFLVVKLEVIVRSWEETER